MALTGAWEGCQTFAYPDPATRGKPWTICYGETQGVQKNDRRTMAECKDGLRRGIEEEYGAAVDRCLTIAAPDRTWIAMTSWTWNLGTGRFCQSIAPVANAQGLKAACEKMRLYDRAAGIRMRGLTRRRSAEYELCVADL